jgi:hypothetical protein
MAGFIFWGDVDYLIAPSAFRYFLGQDGAIEVSSSGRWKFDRCLEILETVPGSDPVLPLNANETIVPCQNSPLLPRDKIVHHYQSIIAPYYHDILLGNPQEAYEVYRNLGINHFYVEKENLQFFGPGYSESFSPESLIKDFDIFGETDGFYILTWRGEGLRPVAAHDVEYIEGLREEARNIDDYPRDSWMALLRMKEFFQE